MAPMYYNSDDVVKRIADALEEIGRQDRLGNILLANDGMYMAGEIEADVYSENIRQVLKELNARE